MMKKMNKMNTVATTDRVLAALPEGRPACDLCGGNCQGCWHSEYCGVYQDTGADVATIIPKGATVKVALCEGRHAMPAEVKGSLFVGDLDPLDVDGLEEQAFAMMRMWKLYVGRVDLYVTGLTVALVAAINAAARAGMELTLYHYDRVSGGYYTQKVEPAKD